MHQKTDNLQVMRFLTPGMHHNVAGNVFEASGRQKRLCKSALHMFCLLCKSSYMCKSLTSHPICLSKRWIGEKNSNHEISPWLMIAVILPDIVMYMYKLFHCQCWRKLHNICILIDVLHVFCM